MANTLQVAEHFAPGTKVAVLPRTTDFAPAAARGAIKTVTVDKKGEVRLDGLRAWGQYWLHDGENAVRYDAPGRADNLADEIQKRADAQNAIREENPHLQATDFQRPDDLSRDDIPQHNFEKSKEPEPSPAAKQADMPKGTWQRTDTPLGTAFPVDPAEIQPQPGKEHVKAGTPQRDGADEGYATPVDPAEVQPAKKYEDEKGKQRQGADTGTAVPIPRTTSKVEVEKAKSDSVSKAKGATVPVAGTDKVPAKKPKGTPKATKTQKAKVAKPVTGKAKRAVKKVEES